MTTPAQLKEMMHGVQCIVITPFKEDGSLDLDGLKFNLNRMLDMGAHGMIVGGSLGEFSSMTMEERKLLFKTSVEAVNHKAPVVCCVADSHIVRCIELAQYAESIGADGVMCTAPYYAACPDEGVIRHYETLAANTKLGIVAYNTGRAGRNMTPKFLEQLVARVPQIVALKQGTRNVEELEETVWRIGDKVSCICGSEVMALAGLALGYVGTTSTNASFMTNIIVDLYNACMANDYPKARDIFYNGWGKYRRLMQDRGKQPSTTKAAMNILGIPAGPVRAPQVELSDELKAELKEILNEMDLRV